MCDDFYSYWFKGIDKAISKLDDNNLNVMLTECGRACSESYTKQVYIDEYSKSVNLDDFLIRLGNKFTEMKIKKISEDVFEIIYTYCACDLVKNCYITNPKFCICSLKSLTANWEAVLGEGNVRISLDKSILAEDDCCKFTVEIIK